jgi:hypothetical protein
MKESKDNQPKMVSELPKVDYSTLPVEIKGVVSNAPFIIEKKTKLTWDGKQFSMRIPSEIAVEMQITKENQVLFQLTKPRPEEGGNPVLKIELL